MSNELVVIKKENALSILSDKTGVEKLIDSVRENVLSMEGGSLETGVGRAKIKSNAFKATKAKKAIADEFITPLIESITSKIQPDLDSIQALKDNQKVLNAGLDKIRKDVNADVQAIEDEIKRKADEEAARIEAEKVTAEIERDHEMALLMDAEFNRQLAERLAKEARIEEERQQAIERERLEREARIAQEAKEQAEREAIQREEKIKLDAQHAAEKAERDRIELIEREAKAKRDAIAAQERAKAQAEEAERQRILAIKEAEKAAQLAAEKAKQDEINRQKAEAERVEKEKAKREADIKNISSIRAAAKDSLIAIGLTEDKAKEVVLAIHNNKIANVKINY